MVLAAARCSEAPSRPTSRDLREALAGNLCRCTGYTRIFEAVEAATRDEREATS